MNNTPDNNSRNDIRGLYDFVTEVGRQTKNPYPLSFQDFSRVMQKESNRRGLYDKLSKRAGIGGTYEDFERAFFNPYASETNQVEALRGKTFTLDPRKEMARHRALLDASRGEYNPYGTSEVSYNPDRRMRGTEIAPIDLVESEDTLPEIATSTGPKTTRTFGGGVVSGLRGIHGGAQIAVADLLKGFGGNSDDEREAIHLINQMEQDGTLSLERVRGLRERLLKDLDSYTNSDIRFSGDYSKKARQADALKLIEERMQRMGQDLTPEKRAVALDAMRSDLREKGASEDKANPFVRWKEGAKDYIRKSEVPEGAWAELGSATASVGGAIAGQLVSMIPGAAPVGQAISWASIGAQTISSGGQAIMDMEDYAAEKGVYISPEDKATIALGYMATEFGGDALGGAVASKSISAIGKLAGERLGKKLAVRSLAKGIAGNEGVRQSLSRMSEYAHKPTVIPLAKSAGRQIVRGAVTEGPGESLTTLAQNGALDRVWKSKEDQEAWADVARQAVKDGIYGAWAGALMGGFGSAIQSGQVAHMHRKEGLTIVQDEKNNLYEVIGADQSSYLVLDRAGRQKMLPADQVVDAIHYTPQERKKSQKAYDEATEGLHPKEEVLTENQKQAGAILTATEQQQSPIYRATHPEVVEEELNSPVALAGAKQALADVLEGQNEEVKTRVDQMALVLQDGEADPTEELTKLFSDESLSDNDRQSILDVVTAQSRLSTIERSHQEAMAQMQSELTKEWSAKSVVGDETARGAVISATITDVDGKPKQVYVTGGVRVVTNEDGTVELLPTDDDAPIYVYDESVDGDEKGHIVQMDDLSSPQLVAEDYLDMVQASLDEAETAFSSEVRSADWETTKQKYGVRLSEEIDENGKNFVLNSEGKKSFGQIPEGLEIPAGDILLSEGDRSDDGGENYGLKHIEDRHGFQIRNAGYRSVVDFVEYVASHYDRIKRGTSRNGEPNGTYLLQLIDGHHNTIYVELSQDGTYWRINSAGVFNDTYGNNKETIRPASEVQIETPQSQNTWPTPNDNSGYSEDANGTVYESSLRQGKGTENSEGEQEDKSGGLLIDHLSIRGEKGEQPQGLQSELPTDLSGKGTEKSEGEQFLSSLPRTREGEVDGLKLMSERPDDFIRYLGQLYGEDFVASLPLSKSGALDLKALTPEQTLRVNEAALGKSGAVEAARQRRSKVGAERSKLEAEVKSDLGNLEKRMALRKASEEYRLYDDYVRTAEEQARQEREAQKRAEEAALTPEERQRREEEKRQLAQEKKEREERIRLENERRRREREELERNAEGSIVREYTEDPPRQARARGARLVNGAVVYRQEPMTVEHYADAERAFSQRPGETRIPVKRTIVEAESLQASHKEGQMNPRHFIPEAQPKDRADNGLSSTAADRIASDIRPDEITGGITAYTGAPVVNGRGEVIQGNNRTDALQTMYDGEERHAKSAELYKEYLKAHASEYGTTAEQVDAMAHPVAVDVAEVSDSEAIRLGHRGQTDLESAGADTMNAQTVGEELNSDTDPQSGQSMLVSFFNRIFNRTGANGAELSAKMDNMLNRNAEEGLQFLRENGYITDTQYKNAFETNSEGKRVVTAEAKTALKDVALYQLADVIGPRAMDIFYRLPASARNGLATFLYRDSQASFETSLAPDLGDALLVWDSLRQDPDFAEQTNFGSAKIFILGKVSLFGRSELETNLGEASSLAKLLAASMQTQTEEQIADVLNQYYDLVGANETGAKTQSLMPTSQPTDTKAGATEAVYGRVYEVPSGREKHYRFRRDVAEDFRTRRDALADRITEERRKHAAAMDMARTFGVPMKLHENMSTLPDEVRAGFDETHSVKGWFYKGDNAVHIYLPANVDADDVRATFLHEAVGHYGCRELLGEVGYNQVLDNIANKLGEEEVLRAMKEYCDGSQDLSDRVQVRIAMDEWVAHRAESGITKKTVWEAVKDFFRKVFGLSGKQIDQSAEMMADDLLRRSAENLQKRADRQQGVATEVSPELSPERSEVRFRSNRSAADFARLRDAAIEQKGLVAPGLNQSSVKVTPVRRHNFTGTGLQAIEKAMAWAQGRIVKDHWYHKGMSDGFKYLIDGTSVEKYLSESSTTRSDNLGVHLATLKVLPRVINRSILAETHPDYGKVNGQRSADNGVNNPNMLVHRLYGAIEIDGQLYRVKTTLHERYNADDRAYDYMVTNMELVISGSSTSDALTSSTNKHTSTERLAVAKLLKGVEKSYDPGKQLLDESESTGSKEQISRFRRAERDEIRSRAIEDGTWMKAPNGENSNLSERDWVTVRTKAFKDWFGDWETYDDGLLDENYEPRVFYHRSPKVFTEFSRDAIGSKTDPGFLGRGFYFFSDPQEGDGYGNNTYPVFLKMKSPYYAENEDVSMLAEAYSSKASSDFTERLKSEGYDGVIYTGDLREELMVFDPEQIKSAIGNTGTFDGTNPDIRYRKEHLAGVHTLTTDNLRHALKMGGLANPSIAVYDTERGLPTRTFGEVALIAPRDLVNAKTGRHKGTYNRDAWTPTYPQVSYELTKRGEDALRSLSDRVRNLGDVASARLLMNEANQSDLSPATLETRLRTNDGIRKLYESEHRGEDYDSYVSSLAKSIEMSDFLFAGQRTDGSWKRVPHTLDNVSKLMKKERAEGSKAYPFAYALSKLGSRYRSLSAIRKGEDLLSGKDPAKWEATRKEFTDLANELQGETKSLFDIRGEEHLAALLADGENLFGRPLTVTEEARVSVLREQMKALPTDYFETKVDRPVGLDEFVEAVVPDWTSPELVSELEKSGLKVSTYDSTKDGAMNEAVLSAMDRADATDRGVRFCTGEQYIEQVNRTFNDELEKFLAGGLSGGHAFNLGLPGAILRATGIPDLPIRITGYQITKKAKDIKHPFPPTILRNLPEALQSPVAVFSYGKNKDMRNIIVNIDYHGENLLIGLVMNKQQSNLKINDVKGLFPKSTSNWLRWIADKKDLYLDRKKIQALVEARQTNPDSQPLLDLDLIAKVQERLEETKHRDEMIARAELQEGEIDGEKALDWLGIAPPKGASAQANPKLSDIANVINGFENPKIEKATHTDPKLRFRRAERAGDVSEAAEAAIDFMRNATPKNTTIDDVLRFKRVYHNSPHLLKKADGAFVDPETGEHLGFDHRFMGSGEGFQAHGWGSYFSVNDLEGYASPNDVEVYDGIRLTQNDAYVTSRGGSTDIASILFQTIRTCWTSNGSIASEKAVKKGVGETLRQIYQDYEQIAREEERLLEALKDNEPWAVALTSSERGSSAIDPKTGYEYAPRTFSVEAEKRTYEYAQRQAERYKAALLFTESNPDYVQHFETKITRHKYVVEIPDPDANHYIKEDRRVTKREGEMIRDAINNKPETKGSPLADESWRGRKWKEAYELLSHRLGGEDLASSLLNKAGFVGIHYNGRIDGECYVIFNENDAKITDHVRFRRTTAEEREKIIERARADGSWLLAPDGTPTTLSEDGWIASRSSDFRAEYGDWEKASNGKWLLGNHYVKELSGNEFEKSETSLIDMVANYYEREHHGCAFRNGIGYVSLSKRTVKDSMAHFSLYRDRVAAFKAVPEVIKHGVQIDGETEWKGRSYDSLTISAPISIGGEGYICTVIVKLVGDDSHGKFYLHKIDLQKNLREELSENNTSENTLGEIEAVVKPHISTGSTPLTIANVLKEYVSHKDDLPESFCQANGEPKREFVEEYLKAEEEKEVRYRRVKADPMNAISPINPQWDGEWYSPEDLTGKSTADLLGLPAAPATPEKRPTQSVAEYAETMSRHYADPRVRFRTGAHKENLRAPQPPRITDGMSLYEVAQLQHEYNRNYRDFSEESMRRMGALDKYPEKFIRSQIDVARPVELFVEEMKRLGLEVSPEDNMYWSLMLQSSKELNMKKREVEPMFERYAETIREMNLDGSLEKVPSVSYVYMKDPNVKKSKSVVKDANGYEKASLYLQAKDIDECKKLGLPYRGEKGFEDLVTNKETGKKLSPEEYISLFENAVGKARAEGLCDQIRAISNWSTQKLYEAGLLTEDRYRELTRGSRRYYVPQRGFKITEDTDRRAYELAELKAEGRQSLSADPVANLQAICNTTVIRAIRNRDLLDFYRWCKKNEQELYHRGVLEMGESYYRRTDEVDDKGRRVYLQSKKAPTLEEMRADNQTRREMAKIRMEKAALREKADRGLISSYTFEAKTKELDDRLKAKEDELIVKYRDPNLSLDDTDKTAKKDERVVRVYENGEERIIALSEDYSGKAVADALNNRSISRYIDSNNIIAKTFRAWGNITRTLSSLRTQYSPAFAVKNAVRDMNAAVAANMGDFGWAYTQQFLRNVPKVQRAVWEYVWKENFGDVGDLKSGYGQYMKEFFEDGAATGYSFLEPFNILHKNLKGIAEPTIWNNIVHGRKGAKNLYATMRLCAVLSEGSELSTRFAEYVTSRERGFSRKEAAIHAKEVTVNFNRHGALSPYLNTLFGFWNASVQGAYRWYRIPLSFMAKVSAQLFITGMLQAYLYLRDDDDMDYTEWDLMTNLCIGNFRYPLPQNLRAFNGAGLQFMLACMGKKDWQAAVIDAAQFMAGEYLPSEAASLLNAVQWDETRGTLKDGWPQVWRDVAPTGISPIVDVIENRNFMGQPVYKMPYVRSQDDNVAHWSLGKKRTKQVYKDFAEWQWKMRGGSTERNDLMSRNGTSQLSNSKLNNPSVIEHLVEGYGGGPISGLSDIGTWIEFASTGDVKELKKLQMIAPFFRQERDYTATDVKYWKLMDFYRSRQQTMSNLRKAKEGEDLERYKEMTRRVSELAPRMTGEQLTEKIWEDGTQDEKLYVTWLETKALLKQIDKGTVTKEEVAPTIDRLTEQFRELR